MRGGPVSDHPTPRLKVRFQDEVLGKLQTELGLANPMQVPRVEKVVLNMGDR